MRSRVRGECRTPRVTGRTPPAGRSKNEYGTRGRKSGLYPTVSTPRMIQAIFREYIIASNHQCFGEGVIRDQPCAAVKDCVVTHLQGGEEFGQLAANAADDPGALLDRGLVVEVRLFLVEKELRDARQTLNAAAGP